MSRQRKAAQTIDRSHDDAWMEEDGQPGLETQPMGIERFFDPSTMSVHIKEGTPVVAKRGRPGAWQFVTVREELATRKEVETWAREIVDAADGNDAFIEIERKGSTIAQIHQFRIVITRPPFADGNEITAVRPVKHLALADYALSEKLKRRLDEQAEGVLIAGAPGHGKSTFAQALAEYYARKRKVVKTVEAPRDLVLPDTITQYAISHGSPEEVHDILLLSRPDYTIFDEMRNTQDFQLFADLRLAGVGMIGVIHGTKTIDAIQRFIGRIDLGVIPHIIDTVLFIKDGAIAKVYSVTMTVKMPSGMTEADLARPVVEVNDFETGKLEFELYTYGEETVVIPVRDVSGQARGVARFAKEGLQRFFERYAHKPAVEIQSENKVTVYVNDDEIAGIIGRGGENIKLIEKELGLSVQVISKSERPRREESRASQNAHTGRGTRHEQRSAVAYDARDVDDEKTDAEEERDDASGPSLRYRVDESKHNLVLELGTEGANASVDISLDGEFLLTAHASKRGKVKLTKKNKLVRIMCEAMDAGKKVEVRASR